MITFCAISGHLILNLLIGWTALSFFSNNRIWAESIVVSLLCGIYLETLFIASLLFIGIPIKISVITLIAGVLILGAVTWRKGNIRIPKLSMGKLKWYEWILLLSIGEKILFGAWQLIKTPLYFDDAMTHWSGRARSLFGNINWSFNPESSVFLGYTGSKNYPLEIPIWRAVTAVFNGSWNDIIGRIDGLVFFITIIISIWLIVWRFSQIRWLATVAAFIISALPLQIWHAVAGYGDIAMEAFAVASLAALLRREWFLAGILAAATAWIKNDGLLLFIPALFIMAGLLQFSIQETIEFKWFQKEKWKNISNFLLGIITLMPWLIFKYIYSLGVTPGNEKFSLHLDAPKLFWDYVINGPSHSIFWIFIVIALLCSLIKMYKDKTGRALLGLLLTSFLIIAFIFTCTDAYIFLINGMTIHRTMLQFYGFAVVVSIYGVWLEIKKLSLK
jgi:hypothetical protein